MVVLDNSGSYALHKRTGYRRPIKRVGRTFDVTVDVVLVAVVVVAVEVVVGPV